MAIMGWSAHQGEGEGRSKARGMDGEGEARAKADKCEWRGCGADSRRQKERRRSEGMSEARTAADMFRAVTPGGTRGVPFCGAARIAA